MKCTVKVKGRQYICACGCSKFWQPKPKTLPDAFICDHCGKGYVGVNREHGTPPNFSAVSDKPGNAARPTDSGQAEDQP